MPVEAAVVERDRRARTRRVVISEFEAVRIAVPDSDEDDKD
jgi:hypothetical protein